jgi:acyl carrier protein
MGLLELYDRAFKNAFSIDLVSDDLAIRAIPAWDSVGHMMLMTEIEDAFDVMLDTEDIIGFTSYKDGIEILRKHDVAL